MSLQRCAGASAGTVVDGRLIASCPLLPLRTKDGLHPCRFCGRTFDQMRVSAHEGICGKLQKVNRPAFSSKQQRIGDLAQQNSDNASLVAFFQSLLGGAGGVNTTRLPRHLQASGIRTWNGLRTAPGQQNVGALSRMEVQRLQQRDLTPEDYELLLRLDESVETKERRLSVSDCDALPVPASSVSWAGESCGVCLSDFEVNDEVRALPCCSHVFHSSCIRQWLTGTRATCPLDKLEVRLG